MTDMTPPIPLPKGMICAEDGCNQVGENMAVKDGQYVFYCREHTPKLPPLPPKPEGTLR